MMVDYTEKCGNPLGSKGISLYRETHSLPVAFAWLPDVIYFWSLSVFCFSVNAMPNFSKVT